MFIEKCFQEGFLVFGCAERITEGESSSHRGAIGQEADFGLHEEVEIRLEAGICEGLGTPFFEIGAESRILGILFTTLGLGGSCESCSVRYWRGHLLLRGCRCQGTRYEGVSYHVINPSIHLTSVSRS